MKSSLEEISVRGHEQVSIFQDETVGLKTIIAIHSNALGPAIGGSRMRPYASFEEALHDVLRLSEGMTYKNALAGIPFGGGKSVIIGDSSTLTGDRRAKFFQSFGRQVEKCGGRYITAEDMGTSVSDMTEIGKFTKSVCGRDPNQGGSGDPSPWTAKGTFDGLLAAAERAFGSDNLNGKHVAVQGVGAVGGYLAKHLAEAGARLTICDPHQSRLQSIAKETGATIVGTGDILDVECDIFAPCAMGGVISESSVSKLKCKVVAGAANNQITTREAERELVNRGIWYAPDFAINAGGVINVSEEYNSAGYSADRVRELCARIRVTVGAILDESKRSGELPGDVAIKLAMRRVDEANAKREYR